VTNMLRLLEGCFAHSCGLPRPSVPPFRATCIANAYEEEPSTYLYVRRLGEVHVVHSVHEVLCGDALTTEETAVQALDRVLAALDTVKFDVHNLPVVAVALFFDVLFELLVPAGFLGTSV
jgi:hypothetical protein